MSFFCLPCFFCPFFAFFSFFLLFLLLKNASNFISVQGPSSFNSWNFHFVLYSYTPWHPMYLPRSFPMSKNQLHKYICPICPLYRWLVPFFSISCRMWVSNYMVNSFPLLDYELRWIKKKSGLFPAFSLFGNHTTEEYDFHSCTVLRWTHETYLSLYIYNDAYNRIWKETGRFHIVELFLSIDHCTALYSHSRQT